MAVSKRIRFEVMRRDGNACRYCGGMAPDVKLTIDERCEAARRMDRAGVSRNVIAAATHLNSRTLWAAFDAEEIAS